jgi:hypothetical protein
MPQRKRNLVKVSATEAARGFGTLATRIVNDGIRVLVQRHGKDSVAMVSLDDLQALVILDDAA